MFINLDEEIYFASISCIECKVMEMIFENVLPVLMVLPSHFFTFLLEYKL